MADTVVEAKDASKVTPEKQKEEKKIEAVDEDSKTSENEDDDKPRENGTVDEAGDESKDAEPESTENGDVKASPAASAKRKSTGAGDGPDVTTPEKKTKVDDKVDSAEANGEAEATA